MFSDCLDVSNVTERAEFRIICRLLDWSSWILMPLANGSRRIGIIMWN